MPDFPAVGLYDPPSAVITTHGSYQDLVGASSSFMNTANAWQLANRAVFAPIFIQQTVTVFQMAIEVTTSSGNLDIGIYTTAGARLVSKGSTAMAAAGVQVIDITDTILNPGTYFAALCIDNTTAAIRSAAGSTALAAMSGVRQVALGSVVLPDPVTLVTATAAMWPYIALATAGTVL
jgi:hypothetical protein